MQAGLDPILVHILLPLVWEPVSPDCSLTGLIHFDGKFIECGAFDETQYSETGRLLQSLRSPTVHI